MLCKRGLRRHAVSVCLSVCLSVRLSVTFVYFVKTLNLQFFMARQRTDARYWYSKSVRPSSVRLSPLRYGSRWKRLNVSSQFFSPYDSPIILVLSASNTFTKLRNSDGVTLCGGAKYKWGIKISRFSTNKSLYLANDTRYCHSYYGRRIGTRMRFIKWCHFQWPWTNPNPVFKVIPLSTLNI